MLNQGPQKKYLNKGSKNCLNKRSKKVSNKASLRELIYAFLLAASKSCDLSLIKKRNPKAVVQRCYAKNSQNS